jgi:hypothetical protein
MPRKTKSRTARAKTSTRRKPNGFGKVVIARPPPVSPDAVYVFTRRCWDVTTTNSGGSFQTALPPDAIGGSTSFITFNTTTSDVFSTQMVGFVFDFAVDTDLALGASVLNLFTEYQVRAARITVSALTSDTYSSSNGCTLPELLWAVDPTGNLTPPGPSALLALEGAKRCTISNERSAVISFRPRLAMGVSVNGGGVFTNLAEAAYNDRANDIWCYSDTPNAPNHAGVLGFMRNLATSVGNAPLLRWECEVTIAARRPH